jgi:hypothetical protein
MKKLSRERVVPTISYVYQRSPAAIAAGDKVLDHYSSLGTLRSAGSSRLLWSELASKVKT